MKKIIYIIISIHLLASCSDMNLVPESNLSPENFFRSEADALSAVYGVYAGFAHNDLYNQFWDVYQSQGTDDSEWGGGRTTNNLDKNALDKFEFDANTTLIYAMWNRLYLISNRANFAIERIEAMNRAYISDESRAIFIGEAKFLRGLAYFTLVQVYGNVPLVLKETVSLDNLEVPKNTLDECYAQIIDDLKAAEAILPTVDKLGKKELGRATKGSAAGLLARVYLYRGDYKNAAAKSEEVMKMGYSLWENYADNFSLDLDNGKESLYEIQFMRNTTGLTGSTQNGYYRPPFVSINGWPGYGDCPVTKNHYECYEEGDLRRAVNTRLYTRDEYPNMSSNYEFPCYVNKYIDLSPLALRASSENNYPILRYSDILLMRAEALNAINPSDAEAYKLLNTVRRRAFGKDMNQTSDIDISEGLSKDQFLDVILLERRREFAFEGQRRCDLLRTKKLKEAMMKQNPILGAAVEDKHYLLPIPVREMDANKLLDQNPGW